MNVKEVCKKLGWNIIACLTCVAAIIGSYIIRERNSSYRKRTREIERIVDTAEDCNRTALDGIEEAERILQKARKKAGKRQDKV